MDPRALLRERGRWTKASILSLLVESPGMSRSAMARALGLTAQAVSVQVQALAEADLVTDADGLRATPAGIQVLQQDAGMLEGVAHRLAAVAATEVVSAMASRPVRAGQVVGLWMRDGDLVADPKDVADSRGVADNDAGIGDEVRVRAPEGVTPLTPGTIRILRVPAPEDGGTAGITAPRADCLVGAVGTGASILARKAGRLDLRFAAAEGALNAAQRGLDVLLFVSEHRLAESLERITVGNRGAVRVEVRVEGL